MKYVIKGLKGLMWVFIGVIGIVIILIIALQFKATQHFITAKAVKFISDKTKTRVELEEVNVSFPKAIELKGFYLEGLHHDTLLYTGRLRVDVDFLKLMSKKLEVNSVQVSHLTAHVSRSMPDSTFNFDFILKAFASGKPAPKDTAPSQWKISLMGLALEDIRLTYADAVTGNDVVLRLGSLDVKMDEFDLSRKRFAVKKITLSNTLAAVIQSKESVQKPDTSRPMDLDLKRLVLEGVHVRYDNRVTKQKIALDLKRSELKANKIDMIRQVIDLDKFSLHNSVLVFEQGRTNAPKTKAPADPVAAKPARDWTLSLGTLDLSGNTIQFDDNNKPEQRTGLDFSHLLISSLDLRNSKLMMKGSSISTSLDNLSFRDKSGFVLRSFRSRITFDSTHAELAKLDIRTAGSHIGDYMLVRYKSLAALSKSIGDMQLDIQLRNTAVSLSDILYLQPGLARNPPFSADPMGIIHLDGKVDGYVNNMNIHKLEASTGQSTIVSAKGAIRGLPDMEHTWFDLVLEQFFISEKDIRRLVPARMIPNTFMLPSTIAVRGYFKGTMHEFNSDINANTSLGGLTARVQMKPGQGTTLFDANLDVKSFELGQFLKQPKNFGAVSLTVKAQGSDLTTDRLTAHVDAIVQEAVINQYPYKNLVVTGVLKKDGFKGKAEIKDENLVFTFDGDIRTGKDSAKYAFTFDLKGADLKALHFTADDIRVSGKLSSDLRGSNINDLNGSAGAHDVIIIKNGKKYPVDSLVFGSLNSTGKTDIHIDSPILKAEFKGNIVMGDLAKVLKEHINTYFDLRDTTISKSLHPQSFTFNADLKDPSLFTDVFFPKLQKLKPGQIQGLYDSESKKMDIVLSLPQVQYNGIRIENLNAHLGSDREKMEYTVNISEIARDSILLRNTSLSGRIKDSISVALRMTDDKKKEKFNMSGIVERKGKETVFHFNRPNAVLNYENWSITPDNYLVFGSFYAHNVKIQKGEQFIYLDSNGKSGDPMKIALQKFDISTFTRLLESKKLLAGGVLDGTIQLSEQKPSTFTSDLTLSGFSYMGDTLGDIRLRADNKTADRYTLALDVTGHNNEIYTKGYYQANDKNNALNLTVDLKRVNLATLQTYSMGTLKELSGSMNGNLQISGSTDAPKIRGNLNFTETLIKAAYINSPITITHGQLAFDDKGINIRNFALKDSLGNTGSIGGYLYTPDYKSFTFDLGLSSNNLLVLNTQEDPSGTSKQLYYGTIFLDSDISVKGDTKLPVVKAKLKLNKGSNFVFIRPEDEVKNEESDNVVVFVDTVQSKFEIMNRTTPQADRNKSDVTGIDLTSNIQLSKEANIKVLVDNQSGDSLVLKGTSNLIFAMDRSGNMTLSGDYNIADGAYQLSFSEFVKRKFELQKGSSITWRGQPTDAVVDITAVYTIKTSPTELVQDQIAGSSEEQKNMYKQKLPFQVFLNIKGEMMKPDITFDIQLPEEQRGALDGSVNAKLIQLRENQGELDKQVFALLVMGRFMADNPFQASDGGGLSSTARNSASQVLTQQLNSLSNKYVKGVDLDLGVESFNDYSTGKSEGRTQLQLGLSKSLFNDKVEVKVGGNLDLEGEKARQNNLSDVAGNISVEYKLTPDGRYRLKGFRKHTYEDMIEGELIETGAGIIFIRDYNKLKELFRKTEKEKKEKDSDTGQ